jgi:UDP-3-O-[3-hydroxymyristoyl] glucosamine N-acyltransferase
VIIANNKPICIIGYRESSMAHEYVNAISTVHDTVVVLEPNEYYSLPDKTVYQYTVSIWIELESRKQIINHVDNSSLDLVTYIDDTARLGKTPPSIIEPGSFIFPFCSIGVGAQIGRHCVVSSYSMIGHYSKIGNGCILRPGVMIVGKSHVGDNCVFNVRSTVVEQAVICNDTTVLGLSGVTKNITQPGRYGGTPARRLFD